MIIMYQSAMAVVVINHNTCDLLRQCLTTVQAAHPCEVMVVDNASSDGSAEMVRCEYPGVKIQANRENVGYGAAANQAIFDCEAEYVLLLNADVLVRPGALDALSSYLQWHPQAAVAGPRLVNEDGTLQFSCYPLPGTFQWLLDNTLSTQLTCLVPFLKSHLLRTWPHDRSRTVPSVKGAALAIRRKAFEAIGGFDESYFLYFEEFDLFSRLIDAGWQIHFAPVTSVVHIGGASTRQYPNGLLVQLSASLRQFLERHYSGMRLMGLVMLIKTVQLIRLISEIFLSAFISDVEKRTILDDSIAIRKHIFYEVWGKGSISVQQ